MPVLKGIGYILILALLLVKNILVLNGSNPITDVKVIIVNKGIRNTPTPYFIYYCWKTNGTETIVRIIEGKKLKELK